MTQVKTNSPLLAVVRQSYATGRPVPWVQVHQVPDFRLLQPLDPHRPGVSCVESTARSTGWTRWSTPSRSAWASCLECHRNPAAHLRPQAEVTNLDWHASSPAAQLEMGRKFVHDWNVRPPESCSGCHR